jgi:hypothetical protein
MPPMDIKQFNALLHSQKGDSELISVLRELTSADTRIFVGFTALLQFFW